MTDLPSEQLEETEITPLDEFVPGEAADTPQPADPAPAEPEPAPAAAAQVEPEGPKEPHWFRKTLREYERDNQRLKRERDEALARQQSQAPQQPAAELPDLYVDPEGYRAAVVGQAEQRAQNAALNARLDTSEMLLRNSVGDEKVDELVDWFTHVRPEVVQWAMTQRDPYKAAWTQYQKEKVADEIGSDPTAYRQRIRDEILAEMAGDPAAPAAANPMTPRPIIPGPASQARSAAPRSGATGNTPLGDMLPNKFGS